MSASRLTYGVVTPARNEVANLPRLARSLSNQTTLPLCWLVVDNGSTDGTVEVTRELAADVPWIRIVTIPGEDGLVRGGPVVRAFQAGIDALDESVTIIVKLDADVSLGPEYFERMLEEFAVDPQLGIASGTCFEQEPDGRWVERRGTGTSVWGATRAYRQACLEDVLPLTPRMGWDGIDALRANLRGWTTRTFVELPFFHHRSEGERDGRRTTAWAAQGKASHYMGYRAWYLVLRSLHHARREPAALAMIFGYLAAVVRREPKYDDPSVRAYLRRQQSFRLLPLRIREGAGRTKH